MTTLITAGQAITLALIGLIGIRLGRVKNEVGQVKADAAAARKNSAAAREQVENDHDTNLREENDSRHKETKGWIDGIRRDMARQFSTVGRDIGGLREELRIDRQANAQRFNNIEDRMTKES